MDPSMFSGLETLYRWGMILLCISVPLALWKLIEIVIYLAHHLSLHWQ